jgi:molybdate transport system ATP-binding protein
MLQVEINGRIAHIDISFHVPAVGSLLIVGPNGAGKSTILMMMLGLIAPSVGRIVVNDRVLFDSVQGVNVPPERREVGFLPQGYALFRHMRVLDNVLFGLECRRPALRRREARALAAKALDEVNVLHLADRYPHQLSGGEAQRVALARAIAPKPQALILDEPTGALDLDSRVQVRNFLSAYLAEQPIPTVVVSHDPDDAAMLPGWIAVLERGGIAQQGPLRELVAGPTSAYASSFVCRTPRRMAAAS